ncbi:molecular chaperone HtpG [Cetobacterium somerae]|uniref:molecular chaperone HtpG n=1 Tax=Cetobacterium somerae TaxID=188913 RepID=UPI0022545466|nr:molecular chaperone HtpG [Cetobacterium somerae]MCX3067408.1 molecular chaperone HtpG [Cetobacterium somerae]
MKKETKVFQAETKELLNLMVHSIYTHKEIFLRELISNASDATDKLKFKALTDTHILDSSEELCITITPNEELRTLTITDHGIGMTFEEVVENIGTIAKSGSKAFLSSLEEAKKNNDLNIIGQFGVGFYSAFMVADKIILETKSPYSDKGVRWTSTGEGSYEIEEIDKTERGTSITLYLKDNDEDKEFLNEYKIKGLIKKYSDYVKYPIMLKDERINSTKPIWKTPKDELRDEDYNEFYKSTYHDWQDPLFHFNFNVQGNLEYNAILFIPQVPPYDLYTREYKRGLQLYTKNVFIMDKCEELIPQYFNFIKGLVDTDDLSLNISREILQKTQQLKAISKNLEKKIISEFEKLMTNDRDKYIKFWEVFGRHIKFGVHENFGLNKDKLENLLLFKSSKDLEYTSLKEYVERMKEDQKDIYYAVGENLDILQKMPKVLNVINKGFEVLYLTEGADEFALKTMNTFKEKTFKSVTEVTFETEEEKEEIKKLSEINKSLLDKIKETLKEKVVEIKLNPELGDSSVSLSSKGEVSLEMEKLLSQIPGNEGVKAEKVLEINPNHPLFNKLQNASEAELKDLSDILYNQGLLIEGFTLENPLDFVTKLNNILSK